LKLLEKDPLTPGKVKEIAYSIMSQDQIGEFEKTLEMTWVHTGLLRLPVKGL